MDSLVLAFLTSLYAVGQLVWIYVRVLWAVECDLSTFPVGILLCRSEGHCHDL